MHSTLDAPRSTLHAPDALTLAPAWLSMAWLVSKAQWFWTQRPDLRFGWIVLLLSGFLIWDSWLRRPVTVCKLTGQVYVLAALGLGIMFVVQGYQAAFGMMPASLLGLSLGVMLVIAANLVYVFGGPGLRHFGFPFAFLLIALPLPSAAQNILIGGLQSGLAALNVELLNLIGIPAHQAGSLIHVANGTVGINEACSGIRSLQATVMATLFVGHVSLHRSGLRILLFALGVTLALFGNLVRSFILSYTVTMKGMATLDKAHDTAGWSILLFTVAGVAVLAWWLGRIERVRSESEE